MIYVLKNICFEASGKVGRQSVTVNVAYCGFDPHLKKLNIYLNLKGKKRGVDFHHSIRDASRIRRIVEKGES